MSQSFDGEGLSAEEIDKLLEDFKCSRCQSSNTLKVNGLNVRFCKDCHSCFLADDSIDLDDLERLQSEGKVIIRPTKRCPCGNDDVNKFVIDGIRESTGQILLECQLCSEKMELETVVDGWQDNDSCPVYDDQSNKDLVEKDKEDVDEEEEISQNFISRTDANIPPPTSSPTKQPPHQGHSQFVCRSCDGQFTNDFPEISPERRSQMTQYNPISQQRSGQVQSLSWPSLKTSGTAICDGLKEGVIGACRGVVEGLPKKQKLSAALKRGLNSVKGVAVGSGFAKAIKGGAFAFKSEIYPERRSQMHQYNPIPQNRSGQVQAFCRRMLKTGGTAIAAGLREGVISACRGVVEGLPKKQILGVGLNAGLNPVSQPARIEVKSLDALSVGDHVSWHRDYLIWHHAIVVAVKSGDGKLTVIHYTGSPKLDEHNVSVREEDIEVDLTRDRMYVYDYNDLPYQPAEVVQRARSRLGEQQYNAMSLNCEHFATWCKTGVARCGQVQAFFRRMLKTGGTTIAAGLKEGVISACRGVIENLPRQQILDVGLRAGLNRVKSVTTGSSVAAAIKGGALTFYVVLNLSFEAGLFAYCACRANRKYKSGLISKPELHREICQVGCECVGGFLCGTGGGILGQLAIPVPFLGTMIGCTLGSLIGRSLGSFAGKKVAEKFLCEMNKNNIQNIMHNESGREQVLKLNEKA